jgi:modulator of FtsH protease HflK
MTRIEFDGQDINIPQVKMPNLGGKGIRIVAGVVLLLILLLTSLYTVDPEEVGVVQRFGEFVRTTQPGLNMKLPFGIESVTKVPIQRQLKAEFGFRTHAAGTRTQYSGRGFEDESHMLTGDLNAAVVEWVVQFRIVDPYKFLFRVRNVLETFRGMSEATMRKVVGDRTVNEVLTIGRQEVALEVEVKLQELCNQYETGLQIDQVVLQNVNPPDQVKASFNEVNEAQQEREKLINQAQSEYNQVIPRARGEALQTVEQARGYALNRVNRAQGDSARFVALFDDYQRAPDVTRRRLYLETMSQILPRVERKYIVDDELGSVLPLLNLGNEAAGN